jgi:hypothetical protein
MATTELVEVAEVAARVGLYWLDRAGAKVVEDWAGRPCVSTADAAKARAMFEADLQEHTEAERGYAEYVTSRDAERAEVGEAAYAKAFEEARRAELEERQEIREAEGTHWIDDQPIGPSPSVTQAATTARRQARERFDRKHPVAAFADWRKRNR